jgi:hypothetical protein
MTAALGIMAGVGFEDLGDVLGPEYPDDRLAHDDFLAHQRPVLGVLHRSVFVHFLKVVLAYTWGVRVFFVFFFIVSLCFVSFFFSLFYIFLSLFFSFNVFMRRSARAT